MSINIFVIEGTVKIPSMNSCHTANLSSRERTYTINDYTLNFSVETLTNLKDKFEIYTDALQNPDFWQHRLFTELFLIHQVVSLTFIPRNLEKHQILFMQNKTLRKSITGFVAHHLNDADKKRYNVTDSSVWYCIRNNVIPRFDVPEDFLDKKINDYVIKILNYFLEDLNNVGLCITFQNGSEVKTFGWIKML